MIPYLVSQWHKVNIALELVKRRRQQVEERFICLLETQECIHDYYDEEAALRESPRMTLEEVKS